MSINRTGRVTAAGGCAAAGRPLHEIETWIFDLDNTLYPASCRLFDQIHDRMQRFIAERLELSLEDALVIQKAYFREHGTTMRGLMVVDKIDPHEFLAYVHEVDLACVPSDPVLAAALQALPGRKIVHTNGSVRHAERLLAHLGIAGSFCGIIDIVDAGFEPKPALAGYHELLRRHDVRPQTALMIEDMAKNLVPAAALGMTTAWMRGTLDWAAATSDGNHIHYVIDRLGDFLAEAAAMHPVRIEESGICRSPTRSARS
ncbi:MAG TPA: pyrimidine 5'-nucleotidase [Stellaceae bacterium]|nr:pyrimidine 5'-nucleotidase [Stellaceae bacterium]